MLIKLHQLPTITGSNSVIHIGTAIFFAGMPEGVWPINNQSKILYCDFTTTLKLMMEEKNSLVLGQSYSTTALYFVMSTSW